MIAIKTHFDGNRVILSKEQLRKLTPGEVMLIFGHPGDNDAGSEEWLKAQEETVNKVWDNDADGIYDQN